MAAATALAARHGRGAGEWRNCRGTVSNGANGYYYELLAPGTLAAGGTAVVAYETGGGNGARLETLSGTTGGLRPLECDADRADLAHDLFRGRRPMSSRTMRRCCRRRSVPILAASAQVDGLNHFGFFAAGDFTVDQTLVLSTGLYVQAAGNIAVADPLTPAQNDRADAQRRRHASDRRTDRREGCRRGDDSTRGSIPRRCPARRLRSCRSARVTA